jgi:small redox-active disulfide protein 2
VHNIKVLGPGCRYCQLTYEMIARMARQRGVAVNLEKVEDVPGILSYGVTHTPGVVLDERVIHSGGIPSRDLIARWLDEVAAEPH